MAGRADDGEAVHGEGLSALAGGKVSARMAWSDGARPAAADALQNAEEDKQRQRWSNPQSAELMRKSATQII